MSRRDLSTETRPLPGEVVTGSGDRRVRFADRREMIHPYDGRVFFSVELTAPALSARLDEVTNYADGHGLVDFLATRLPGDWVSADGDLAVRLTGTEPKSKELTWRIRGGQWSAEVTVPFDETVIDELREFLIVAEPVDTGAIATSGHWGAQAVERAARGARISTPAWLTAIERTSIGPGTTVLDLACGSGEFCGLATEHGATATGIDGSAAMITLAQQTQPGEFHVWPLGRLPWEDNSFDVVTAFNALFFARDPEYTFTEAIRVSRNAVVVCHWHDELTSDLMTIGRAVRGPSAHRRPNLPEPQEKLTIEIPVDHPDEDSMVRTMLTLGSYQPLIESEGEEKVAERIREATKEFRTAQGGYRFANYYQLQIFRK